MPADDALAQDKKFRIGFSQATTIEPWRAQFNKDIIAEAAKHPDVELIITDGEDRTEKQVADVENLIRQEVDALLVSPKESAGLTGVVQQAIDAKIPVFVLDRNVETDQYTQFVGGDNKLIGRAAGEYAVELLGGKGKAEGNIVEIWGGMGTQPAHDRHDGFHEFTDKEPGIKNLLISNPATGSRTRPTTSWRRRCATTRRSTSYTATTIRWPMAPTWRRRTQAVRRK